MSVSEQHWKQLGFMRGDPQIEFDEVPPGILALDCMVYFAKAKHKTFTRLLFAHIDNQCPFAQTSIICPMQGPVPDISNWRAPI